MKKLIRIVSLVLLSSVVLIGCGKGDGDVSSSSSSAPSPTLEETLGYTATDLLSTELESDYIQLVCEGEIVLKTVNENTTITKHSISEQMIEDISKDVMRTLCTTTDRNEDTSATVKEMNDTYYVRSTSTIYHQTNYDQWTYYNTQIPDAYSTVIKGATDTAMELKGETVYVTGSLSLKDKSSITDLIKQWLAKYEITDGNVEFTAWYNSLTKVCEYLRASVTSEAVGKYQERKCMLESMDFYYTLVNTQTDKKLFVPDNVKLAAVLDETKQAETVDKVKEALSSQDQQNSSTSSNEPVPTSAESSQAPVIENPTSAVIPQTPEPDIGAPPA